MGSPKLQKDPYFHDKFGDGDPYIHGKYGDGVGISALEVSYECSLNR